MVHNSIINQNSESFIRLFHTAVTGSPYSIGLTVSSELRIIYSPVLILYRGNWIIIYRGNRITIYRGITYIARLQNCSLLFHFEQWSHQPTVWPQGVGRGAMITACIYAVSTASREREWAMF